MKVSLQIRTLAELSDAAEILDFARMSDLMIEMKIDGERAGLIGFIPQVDKAYLWMLKTSVADGHPTVFARYAKRIVDCYTSKYKLIWGHSTPESERWLKFLGAEIEALPNNIVEFKIRGK